MLCAELSVSAATLRRDLSELEETRACWCARTVGPAHSDPSDSEIPVRLRDHWTVAAKRRDAAALFVPAGPQAVALTGGVTTGEVARALEGPAPDDHRHQLADHRGRLRDRRSHEGDRDRRPGRSFPEAVGPMCPNMRFR